MNDYQRTPIARSDIPKDVIDGILKEEAKIAAQTGQLIPRFIEGVYVFDGCWYGMDRATGDFYKVARN